MNGSGRRLRLALLLLRADVPSVLWSLAMALRFGYAAIWVLLRQKPECNG